LKRDFGDLTVLRYDLGYIPSDIESVNGDTNISSTTVIASLQELFDNGKLMVSNFVPYVCCNIHLRKPMEYWKDDRSRKFAQMADEIFRAR
jgi:hypothetical protein